MRRMIWKMTAGFILAALSWVASAQDCGAIAWTQTLASNTGPATRLAIVLHGMDGDPAHMMAVGDAIQNLDGYRDTDIVIPQLPFSAFSAALPSDILVCLVKLIDSKWRDKQASGSGYKSILLVGHSMGSLFARKLYVIARGELPGAPFEPELKKSVKDLGLSPGLGAPREWFSSVERIVLLAAINRGWTVDHHLEWDRIIYMQAGLALNRMAQAVELPAFTVMATRRGAPFVTQLRLQWLAMMECSQTPEARAKEAGGQKEQAVAPRQGAVLAVGDKALSGEQADTESEGCKGSTPTRLAPVVQLLGSRDDLVPPADNIDAVAGRRFTYLNVPHSNHGNVVEMAGKDAFEEARRRVFVRALDKTDKGDAPPELLSARTDPDYTVKHVVFVMHGIRDEGFWTERLGAKVRAKLEQTQHCTEATQCRVRLEASSYGYFAMLSFLKPGSRNEKVEWLMDRYTEAKAQYPAAKFYYVGHSHGTYLLKEALKNYEAVKFERVVLAGSVLRSDHDWLPLIQSKRIGSMLNLSAAGDWVVAFFPNAMQMMHLQDLGGAGFYGFEKKGAGVTQVANGRWVVGGHGAAVAEDWWEPVAEFIATGSLAVPDRSPKLVQNMQSCWVAIGGAVAPLLWLLIAAILGCGGWAIVRSNRREWVKTLGLVFYGWFIWFVVTSV